MKIVLDTNIIISALLWTGIPHQIFKIAGKDEITICTTHNIIKELQEVLLRTKFEYRIKELNTSIEELTESFINLAELYPDVHISSVIKDDPSDDKFLACAKYSSASYIVSADKHLLKLKSYEDIPILMPSIFLLKYGQSI